MATKSIFIIDSRVVDYQRLVADLPAESQAFVLNADQDGIAQMQAILSNFNNLDSIQIVSHGAQGVLYLGSTVLNQENIDSYRNPLGMIGSSLAPTGDLLLYGCNVAQGDEGQRFIDRLAQFTGADVAASNDATGNTVWGGDWDLEAKAGKVEVLPQALDYQGLLGLTVSPNTRLFPGHTLGEFGDVGAFAAIKADGSVVTWGIAPFGGDSSAVASQLNGAVGVTQIYSTGSAFAALRADGSVVTWGDAAYGGDSSAVASQLNGAVDVTQIYSTGLAFAALRTDGSVVTWGYANLGGESSAVASQLSGAVAVTQIFSTEGAFAALRADGSVVTWGDAAYGGDSSAVASQLDGTVDVTQVFSTGTAFAALRADGSVVTWGDTGYGGDSSAVADKLTSGVVSFANIYTDDVYTASTNNPPTGTVTINVTNPNLGQTLIASNTLDDADGVGIITYQWKAGDTLMGVGDTYTVAAGDIGKPITVTASYTDGFDHLESVSSAATREVTDILLSKADDIFKDEGRFGGDGTDAGILDTGMIRVMADFSKAAYDLQTWEMENDQDAINDISPNADSAKDAVLHQWKPLDLNPTLDSATTLTGSVPDIGANWAVETTNKMSGGYYTNGNAAAFVAESSDSVVISFRGTNDNADQYSPNKNINDPTNDIHPDTDQWGDDLSDSNMSAHYALFNPLLTALDEYVRSNPHIEKIYVTGHSMGGAMAINYMAQHPGDSRYQGITFAAPAFTEGYLNRKEFNPDNRLLQIEIDEDPVPATNLNRPGDLITFVGNRTKDEPDNHLPLGMFNDDNHSMDYYRQITDSIDPTSWSRILIETGDQSVYIGAASGPNFDDIDRQNPYEAGDPFDTYFIVDGLSSDTSKDPGNNGDNVLEDPSTVYDIFYGGRGNDMLTGGIGDELMLGGIGNDTLKGLTGNDHLFGSAGDDWLYGGFSLDSGAYVDSLYGGLEDDNYVIYHTNDKVIEYFDQGIDTVRSYLNINYTLPANIENLILNNSTSATGNNLSNTMTGNDGKNTLKGMGDIDILIGNGGNDTLIGGQGADHLNGGADSDIFKFDSITESGIGADNRDIILDFNNKKGVFKTFTDRIDLQAIDAKFTTATNDKFTWIGTAAFTHAAGELRYFLDSGSNTIVEGDVNADGSADFQIQLAGIVNLVKGDFIL